MWQKFEVYGNAVPGSAGSVVQSSERQAAFDISYDFVYTYV
jgi:hypothetical protein